MIDTGKFVAQWLNKVPNRPGAVAGQCVALYRCYLDYLDVPQTPTVVGAKDLWTKYDPTHFVRLPNTITFIPQEGDIFIMDAFKGCPTGHVGIVTRGATIFSFLCFESNWSWAKHATRGKHGYLSPRVIGFLRKK